MDQRYRLGDNGAKNTGRGRGYFLYFVKHIVGIMGYLILGYYVDGVLVERDELRIKINGFIGYKETIQPHENIHFFP